MSSYRMEISDDWICAGYSTGGIDSCGVSIFFLLQCMSAVTDVSNKS